MKPFFEEYCEDDKSLVAYRDLLAKGSKFLEEVVCFGNEVIQLCIKKAQGDTRRVHFTLLGLARHQLAYMDSVNVLLGRGCVEASSPLLRSMLESQLGIAHIVQGMHQERALAYELVRIKRRLKALRMVDKTHADGKQLEAELASDVLVAGIFDKMPKDLSARAAVVEAKLADPIFIPNVAEWERLKRSSGKPNLKDPEWFSLFGGGNTIRDLAKNLGLISQYTFIYKELSNAIHAATALDGFAEVGGDLTQIRPLRHPGGYHKPFRGVFIMFLSTFDKLLGFYDKQQQGAFLHHMMVSIEPKFSAIIDNMEKHLPRWYSVE